MTVFAYLRVSSKRQDEENQKVGIKNLAERFNLSVDFYYIEKISGTKKYRERKLGRLLKKIKKDDIILVSELSRLSRNLSDMFSIMEIVLNKQAVLYSVKENFKLDTSISSKILVFAFGLAAEIERKMISDRTREALLLRKEQGKKLGRPVGSKNKQNILEQKKKKIFILFKKGLSQNKICKKINCSPKTLRKFLKERGYSHNST